jgi:transcriptional repressor NrdR
VLVLVIMKCPYCNSQKTKVVDKRELRESSVTRRRRECLECKKRFTTYERIETVMLTVVKKDGSKEVFDRSKIERGILKASEKRPITPEQIMEMSSEIETMLLNKDTTEISSSLIGRMVMSRLKKLDTVAYIRFASVYKEFKDPEDFGDALKDIKK